MRPRVEAGRIAFFAETFLFPPGPGTISRAGFLQGTYSLAATPGGRKARFLLRVALRPLSWVYCGEARDQAASSEAASTGLAGDSKFHKDNERRDGALFFALLDWLHQIVASPIAVGLKNETEYSHLFVFLYFPALGQQDVPLLEQ